MNDSEHNALMFWLQVQQQIHENIKFADTKAVQVVAINVALIGALYAIAERIPHSWRAAALCVAVILGVGVFFAVSVIRPRGERNRARGPGVIDAIRISLFDAEAPFTSRLASMSPQELLSELQLFVYDRAYIDRVKYEHLRWSIGLSAVAWVLAFALAAGVRLSSSVGPAG